MNRKLKASLSMFLSAAIATTSLPVVASAESDYTASTLETVAASSIGKASETVAVELPAPATHPVISVEQLAIPAEGITATSGTATITITSDGVLTISGTAMADFASAAAAGDAAWYPYLESVKEIIVEDTVTSIGAYAFDGFTSVTKITLGKKVNNIGQYAFYGCTALKDLVINATNLQTIGGYSFYNCAPLASLTIPETVTSIGDYAFNGCKNITELSIPGTIGENLGAGAFYGCTSLKTVVVNNGITQIKDLTFADCSAITNIAIPTTGLTSIGNKAFYGCVAMSTVNGDAACLNIPTSVTTIGEAAFANCSAIKKLLISGGVTSIGKQAFMSCGELNAINISGSQATTIGEEAFMSCGKLTTATLDSGKVTLIDKKAFYQSGLESIVFSNGLATIGEEAFAQTHLKAVKLPATVTAVNKKAFNKITELTSVEVVNSERATALTFGDSVFEECTALTSLKLEGTGTFGATVFKGCTALTAAEIPSTTIKMGTSVFMNCTKLTDFTIAEGAQAIGNMVINNCPVTTVIIPESVVTNASAFNGQTYLETATVKCANVQMTMFKDCEKLSRVTLTNTESIAGNAFENCTSLKNITLPETLKTLGTYVFKGCTSLQSLDIPQTITIVPSGLCDGCTSLTTATYGDVTSIQAYAFRDCKALKTALIPATVTTVGQEAFKNCQTITSATVSNSKATVAASAFAGCTNLATASFPAELVLLNDKVFMDCVSLKTFSGATSATTIGASTFQNCKALTGYAIPSTVTKIGTSAFEGCSLLDSALPTGLQALGMKAFKDCVSLGKAATIILPTYEKYIKIENETFSGCTSLPKLNIPDNITGIGDGAFKNCSSPKFNLMIISQYVKTIGGSAFEGCTSLTNVTINSKDGTSCTALGSKSFADCSALESITLPTTLITVNSSTFLNCKSLKSITLPESVTTLGTNAFEGCTNLAKASIAATQIKSISNALFKNCKSLQTIAIPNTATSISANAFEGCTALEEVSIPGTVNTIQANAFDGCTSLEFVVLPVALSSFGNSAFANCTSLETVIFLSMKSPAAASKFFENCEKLTIYCYEGSLIEKTYAANNGFEVEYLTGENGSYVVILKQPQGVSGLQIGDTAEFTVKVASEGEISYEWFYKNPGDSSFTKAEGFTGDTYSAIVTDKTDGQLVYCVVTSTSAIDPSAKNQVASETTYITTLSAPEAYIAVAGANSVKIGWNKVDAATSYQIYRAKTLADEMTYLGATQGLTFTDDDVTSGETYLYFVRAVNSNLTTTPVKSDFCTPVKVDVPAALAAPANVNAVCSSGTVAISWDAADRATSYRVYRAESATGAKTLLKTVGTTSCTDTTATTGKTYYYFIQAYNSKTAELSGYSAAASTYVSSLSTPKLNSVTASGTTVSLKWSAVTNATSYRVYRSTSANGTKTLVKTVGITSCTDTSVTAGNTYYYTIVAYNSKTAEVSSNSNTVSVVVSSIATPTLTSATANGTTVSLTWSAVTGATSYKVYRAESATATPTLLKSVGITSCTDTTAVAGKTYYYYVAAYNSKTGALSNKSAARSVKISTLTTPTITSGTASGNTVTLKWNAVSGATSYRIYRSTSAGGTKSLLKTVGITSCTDTSTVAGNTYYYYVVAYSSKTGDTSAYSTAKSVTVSALAAPSITSVTATSSTCVSLKWSAVSSATSYKVYRSTSSTGAKTLLKTVGITSCNDTTVVAGQTYYYYIVAYNSKTAQASAYSTGKSITVSNLETPEITSTSVNGTTVSLSWDAVDNATSYRVYRATSATGTRTLLKTVGITSCSDATVTAGKTYYYYVAAYNSKTGELSSQSAGEAVTISTLDAPEITSATVSGTTVTLKWTAVDSATSYKIYRATTSGGAKSLIKSVGITSCNDTTVTSGNYFYFVAAYNSKTGELSGYSDFYKVTV